MIASLPLMEVYHTEVDCARAARTIPSGGSACTSVRGIGTIVCCNAVQLRERELSLLLVRRFIVSSKMRMSVLSVWLGVASTQPNPPY
eukprot:SAG31_NODE_3514_length_4171_cov_6.906925_4_plen_88_part_00